jgi:hypothetical protein
MSSIQFIYWDIVLLNCVPTQICNIKIYPKQGELWRGKKQNYSFSRWRFCEIASLHLLTRDSSAMQTR